MSQITLIDSMCRIKQAQAVLSLWLGSVTTDDGNTDDMIAAIQTLLHGIPDILSAVEDELIELDKLKAMTARAARGKQ